MVVRRSLALLVGKSSLICFCNAETEVDSGTGRDSVGGRPRPPNDVIRTFNMLEPALAAIL